MSSKLTFYGAVKEVTGSCYLLQTNRSRVLLECGLHQGPPDMEKRNFQPFPFPIEGIDAVVVSHAHLDHSGLLPKLAADGYSGPVYCTEMTHELLKIMLMDAAHLQQRDTEWSNRRRRRAGAPLEQPLYTSEDVEKIIRQCIPLPYHGSSQITGDIGLSFLDAGHILGSAHVSLTIEDAGQRRRLLFSGDIGNPESVLMKNPEPPQLADVVLMEGTYGNRDHQSMGQTLEEFAGILAAAAEDGGNVLIPAFAVGRTQEIIYQLLMLRKQGRLQQQQVFLDSPMAIEVSELYLKNLQRLDRIDIDALTDNGRASLNDMLHFVQPTRSAEESMAINRVTGGAIVIAGSGMCSGGRIRHHLKHNLWRRETRVVIVGFQANGTLGRRLVDGAERVSLFGEDIIVRAHIHTLGGYSAHAGRSDLLRWARAIGGEPRYYLVHGEAEALQSLQAELQRHGASVDLPVFGHSVTI